VLRSVSATSIPESFRPIRPYPNIRELLHGISDIQVFDLYYSPRELGLRVGEWVEYYNNHRSHKAINIDNVTPSDNYFGKLQEILEHRKKPKNRKFNRFIA
jgi:hypothetical protein